MRTQCTGGCTFSVTCDRINIQQTHFNRPLNHYCESLYEKLQLLAQLVLKDPESWKLILEPRVMPEQATLKIPFRQGSAIWGNVTEFRSDLLGFLEACRKDQGIVAGFRLGHRRLVMVSDPELIGQVLVSQNKSFKKHFAARLLKPFLGNGLLLNEGDSWLKQRKLIQPAFSQRFMDNVAMISHQHSSRLAQDWIRSPRRDLYEDMTRLTVQIAAEAFLGISTLEDASEIAHHLEVIHEDFESRFQQVFPLPLWIPTRRNRKLRTAIRGLTSIIDRIIELRRAESDDKHDALSLLLRATDEQGNKMSHQQLRDEVMTLLLAGHDTTANGLTWSWILLSNAPEQLSALRHSKNETQDRSQAFDQSTLHAEKIFKEAMRLFPPVYLFGREATKSVSIGDFEIHRGVSVVFSPWIVHRDEEIYSNPFQFTPNRWTTEFEKSLPRYSFFPFGGGPRICLGKYVAMVEAATVLATLAKQFDLSVTDSQSIAPWPTVTLRPRGPVRAQVAPLPPASGGQSLPIPSASVCPHTHNDKNS